MQKFIKYFYFSCNSFFGTFILAFPFHGNAVLLFRESTIWLLYLFLSLKILRTSLLTLRFMFEIPTFIWICTVCKGRVYTGSAGLGLIIYKKTNYENFCTADIHDFRLSGWKKIIEMSNPIFWKNQKQLPDWHRWSCCKNYWLCRCRLLPKYVTGHRANIFIKSEATIFCCILAICNPSDSLLLYTQLE